MATQMMSNKATATLGTTPVIRLPKAATPNPIQPGQGYFRLRLHSAQAAIFGPFWQKAQQLLVTSEVRLYMPPFNGEPIQSLQRVRSLKQGAVEQLGLNPNLIDLTPASLDKVSVDIDFLLDRQNRLVSLARLVNDDAFLSVISLAPGAVAVAKAIGGISRQLVDTFLDENDQTSLLKFSGDFSLAAGDLADAYYVILGSTFDQYPLPRPIPGPPRLQVSGNDLLLDNQPVVHWSYIIFDIDVVEMRTRELGRSEPWYDKLSQVEVQATQASNIPWLEDKDRKETWEACLKMLKDSDLLLHQSPLYLPSEANNIIQQAYYSAYQKIYPPSRSFASPVRLPAESVAQDLPGVGSLEELKSQVDSYRIATSRSQGKLRSLGMLS